MNVFTIPLWFWIGIVHRVSWCRLTWLYTEIHNSTWPSLLAYLYNLKEISDQTFSYRLTSPILCIIPNLLFPLRRIEVGFVFGIPIYFDYIIKLTWFLNSGNFPSKPALQKYITVKIKFYFTIMWLRPFVFMLF